MGEFTGVDSLCNGNIDNERLNCKLLVENPEAENAIDSIFMCRSYLTLCNSLILSSNLSSSDSSPASGCPVLGSSLFVSSSVFASLPVAVVYLIAAVTACTLA